MKWFLVWILFSSCSSTIEFHLESVGEMDKPLPVIHLISDENTGNNNSKESFSNSYSFQLKQKELMNMYHSIEKNTKLNSFNEKAIYPYGSYKFSLVKDGVVTHYVSKSNCITYELIEELKVMSLEQKLLNCFEILSIRLGCLKN